MVNLSVFLGLVERSTSLNVMRLLSKLGPL